MKPVETWLNADGHEHRSSAPPLLSDNLNELTRRFGFGGPNMVVSTACSSGLTAIIEAAMLVQTGQAKQMLVCAADIANGFIQDWFRGRAAAADSSMALLRNACRYFRPYKWHCCAVSPQ